MKPDVLNAVYSEANGVIPQMKVSLKRIQNRPHCLNVLQHQETCPCNIYLLKPHFYIAISIFLIFAPKHRLWVPVI